MKILSMTAVFGKLNGDTLSLQENLSVIHAPNEWGKSTWCAFIETMLYGIDTGARSKSGYLADKEHYAPWSGAPMSGRMDILWNGREITIERKSKNRTPLGEVYAFETKTGLAVPELCVNNCGEVLLGVERSVFVRSVFLKQSQMPVTEDEKLRRRLNELVTTGDESGQSDMLAQKLKDLKNRCRFNKKGLLPELEGQLASLEQNLQHLASLQTQIAGITQRQTALKEENRLLENHLASLTYQENLAYTQKMETARQEKETAARNWETAKTACENLPSGEIISQNLSRLAQLRDTRETLSTQAQQFSPLPEMPYAPEIFRGRNPETILSDAKADAAAISRLQKDKHRPIFYILGSIFSVAGIVLPVTFFTLPGIVSGCILLILGIACLIAGGKKARKLQKKADLLLEKYRGLSPDRWVWEAEQYAATQTAYQATLSARQQELESFNRRKEENKSAIEALTGGLTPVQFEQVCQEQLGKHRALADMEQKLRQAETLYSALTATHKDVTAPTFPDTLQLSRKETEEKLLYNQTELISLEKSLGLCQGQMESHGQTESQLSQKKAMEIRRDALQTHYDALILAMDTLDKASQELQRRFAPRISQKAQEFFSRLTKNRYSRLTLCQDLSLETAAEGETTLRGSLWRSDGTVDQLYLALRLAVAGELTPNAPLILDDALVRFDDTRMAAAMELLKEESAHRQVILFTCQKRETEV